MKTPRDAGDNWWWRPSLLPKPPHRVPGRVYTLSRSSLANGDGSNPALRNVEARGMVLRRGAKCLVHYK